MGRMFGVLVRVRVGVAVEVAVGVLAAFSKLPNSRFKSWPHSTKT